MWSLCVCASVFFLLFFLWSMLFMQLMRDSHLHTLSCGVWNHSQWFDLMFTRLYNRRLPWWWEDLKTREALLIRGLLPSPTVSFIIFPFFPFPTRLLAPFFVCVVSPVSEVFCGVKFWLLFCFHVLSLTNACWHSHSLSSRWSWQVSLDGWVWDSWQRGTTTFAMTAMTYYFLINNPDRMLI